MSRVDELQRASRSYSRAWQDFIKAYAKEPERLYCFFEGKDDPKYYGPRIDSCVFQHSGSSRFNLWCEGKDNVITLYWLTTTDTRYQDAWTAFFVDRDFDNTDEFPDDPKLYVTPCYSVENLYVTRSAFARILQDEFGLSEIDPDYERTLQAYVEARERFNDAAEEINAWIYLHRQKEKECPSGTRLNLNSLPAEGLFQVKISVVGKLYTLEMLKALSQQADLATQSQIDQQVSTFVRDQRTSVFRGKYLIFFLHRFVMCLVEDSNSRKNRKHFSKRRRVSLQLSGNVLSELGQYADTPVSLILFLEKRADARPVQLAFSSLETEVAQPAQP